MDKDKKLSLILEIERLEQRNQELEEERETYKKNLLDQFKSQIQLHTNASLELQSELSRANQSLALTKEELKACKNELLNRSHSVNKKYNTSQNYYFNKYTKYKKKYFQLKSLLNGGK